jgi:glycosyltransferase involved in cell wall biosynthesis
VPLTALHRQPGFRPGLAMRVADAARRTGATVLHCHHYSPFVYGRLAALGLPGTRVIYTEHGRLSDDPPSRKRRMVNRLLTRGVHDLVAVSHDLRSHLLDEALPERMRVIWNGIDPGEAPSPESRAAARAALRATGDEYLVATVARLDPVKDLGTLIRAVAATRRQGQRLLLAIIGDGQERAALESMTAAEGVADAVRFLGHRDDARALLAGADVYANSSTSEGISLTLLEAMAAELPVVATGVGGSPEVVVNGETGRTVPARDASAMAGALLDLDTNRSTALRMGREGRRRVLRHFTIDRMVQDYASIYGLDPKIMS